MHSTPIITQKENGKYTRANSFSLPLTKGGDKPSAGPRCFKKSSYIWVCVVFMYVCVCQSSVSALTVTPELRDSQGSGCVWRLYKLVGNNQFSDTVCLGCRWRHIFWGHTGNLKEAQQQCIGWQVLTWPTSVVLFVALLGNWRTCKTVVMTNVASAIMYYLAINKDLV